MVEVACPPKQLVPRAFQTEWQGVRCIVFSSSASKARYATYKAAKDAGWNPLMTEIKVCRMPFYDNAKTYTGDAVKENRCYSAEYLS